MLAKSSIDTIDPQVAAKLVVAMAIALQPQSGIEGDAEMIDLWLQSRKSKQTRKEYRRDADYFLAWFGGELRSVTLKDMVQYQQACIDKGWRPATVRRKVNAVRSLFRFAVKTGYLHAVPGEGLDLPPDTEAAAVKVLSEVQVIRLVTLTQGRDRVIIRLMYASGGRCSEIGGLKWKHCKPNPDGTAVVTLFGKGAKTRAVVISAETWAELAALRGDGSDESPVFPSRSGQGHLSRVQLWRVVSAAAAAAGIPGKVSPHWFRHSHATHRSIAGCRCLWCRLLWVMHRSPRLSATFTRTLRIPVAYTWRSSPGKFLALDNDRSSCANSVI
ncbi:MAG: tyrosine-type recombinase/integrase [Alkalinema sp. RU_4_3]|nr:tyrosine-type recombinase/integrase [Alkalinema sp. RU_4_3]